MKTINSHGRILDFNHVKVMGILNLTPDSFYDGNRYNDVESAMNQVRKMVNEGMDILDIGAASSRPGAKTLPPAEEWNRMQDILKEVISEFPDLPVSVDTYWSEVADNAINIGASMINDISGFEMDPNLLDVISDANVPYILMHMKGTPKNMQQNPKYNNVSHEIMNFFVAKIRKLHARQIFDVIIDPGFGFGKLLEHNYRLLNDISLFRILDKPILSGVSRKSMIYHLLDITPEESLYASSALHLQLLLNGTNILRVHDVKETKQIVKVFEKLKEFDS